MRVEITDWKKFNKITTEDFSQIKEILGLFGYDADELKEQGLNADIHLLQDDAIEIILSDRLTEAEVENRTIRWSKRKEILEGLKKWLL